MNRTIQSRLKFYCLFLLGTVIFPLFGQTLPDTSQHIEYLSEINLVGKGQQRDVMMLPEIVGTKINAGKKNSLVVLDQVNNVVVNNSMRQILAKVPGIQIWESDGSGIQIGIANRGLSPNRSWEFNIRQNGADISADPFGYPEAYYNPQMQAVQRIQIIRGAGALQYGPQFGGMINYIMKDGSNFSKPLQLECNQTVGSFGLYNAFIGLGGKGKKGYYYTFFDRRSADGYRSNSQYQTQTMFGSATYQLGKKTTVTADYMRYNMESQQPGGITDNQLYNGVGATLSHRSRNWFTTPWNTLNVKLNHELSQTSRIQLLIFGMSAVRHSVGNIASILIPDTINNLTGQYSERDLSTDKYKNAGTELSYLKHYRILGMRQTISSGIRVFRGQTQRFQKGIGSTGVDANFSTTKPFPVELAFNTLNVAWFAEQIVRVNSRFIIIPGVRLESIHSTVSGRLGFTSGGEAIPVQASPFNRKFFLGGMSAEYHLKNGIEIYGNLTQNYRPALFTDLQAMPSTEQIDPNLKDATGSNNDLGIRGRRGNWLYFDGSLFVLQYNNRIGRITRINELGNAVTVKTNVGNSVSTGIEGILDIDWIKKIKPSGNWGLPIYVSYALTNAKYGDYDITVKNTAGKYETLNLKGNWVENAPRHILRAGMGFQLKSRSNPARNILNQIQWSYVSGCYSDANNTLIPLINGINGYIPEYHIFDWNTTLSVNQKVQIKFSINNLLNRSYFTRRSGGYPGPGLLPSDGRSILCCINIAL
ncbi:MAG: TonB-dependent receptor [Flavobacteriaceae bacterium]|nr:TonB-dependent receptor [Flavobacteriaceae bacterium]